MSWTKRQFVNQAFEEIGFAYGYNLQPDQLQSALRKLDAMMAQWNGKGIRLGYPIPSSPENSNLDTESGVPDFANEAIYLNLALRIGPTFGKQPSMETKQFAKQAYNSMLSKTTMPQERQITGLPSGAGNKTWRSTGEPFLLDPTDPLEAGPDSELEFY